jgi:phospholipase/carboxylesterase
VAYDVGLRHRPRPAAIFALGGRLPGPDELDLGSPLPPVLIAHGSQDDSVPVESARHARAVLTAAGASVSYLETSVGHRIDQNVLPQVREFLRHALPDDPCRAVL